MTTKFQVEPERLPPAWISMPGVVVAIVLLFPSSFLPSPVHGLKFDLTALPLAGLYLGAMAASLFRWEAARVLAVAVLALYWVAVGVVCFIMLLGPTFFLFMVLYAGAATIPGLLIVWLCTAYARRGLKRTWWLGSVVGGFICGFVIAAVIAAPELKGKVSQTMRIRATEPIVLNADMVKLAQCSHEYAALHPATGYPESLRELVPNGTGCLPEALMRNSYKGFSITYSPGVRNAHGIISSFTIRAEQAVPHGPDFSIMSTDESGLVLYTNEGPQGKGTPFSYVPAESAIEKFVGCLQDASVQNWSKMPEGEERVHKCLGDKYVFTDDRKGEVGVFRFAYSFEHNGFEASDGFTAEVRPRTYGIGGIRSYLIVGKFSGPGAASEAANGTLALRVYATPEDRPATPSDPFANICEIKWAACIGPAKIN